ncbi:hypothetical protein SAMN05444414_112123 [Roseovarius marisflavi]|uniref:Uncharacterized protein n=2 Tax=Roseovarius marisflavi TaxID=1054996 RepID=A0A1M7A9A1_9RHOB|nr:hypothetical protein SAMN05444414_112123 [Roseovarius marisflavi]
MKHKKARRMKRLGLVLATISAMALGFSGGVHAASETEGYDLIFRTSTLDAFAPGDHLRYEAEMTNEAAAPQEPQLLDLVIEDGDKARLSRDIDGKHQSLAVFDASVGNPMAMFFLERLVRDLAAATGGSKFYIRNRIKESLLAPEAITSDQITYDAAEQPAKRVTLAPFVADQNRARLGPFADLRIDFLMSDAVPGWYHVTEAATPKREAGGRFFHSTLHLSEEAH